MASVLSRSLASALVDATPDSAAFGMSKSNRSLFTSLFFPRNGLKKAFSRSGLKWKLDMKRSGVVVSAVAEKEAPERAGQMFEYQPEVRRLIDLIEGCLNCHSGVFLQELVSNASDALDKLKYLSMADPTLLGDGRVLEIRIKADPENGTLTITDTGIGMTKDELFDCLGTVPQSVTSKFLKALKEAKDLKCYDNCLIGQLGVGFYSVFQAAEKVVVETKSPRSDKQYVWESQGGYSYSIREETDPEKFLGLGTAITLYFGDMGIKFEHNHPIKIKDLVQNYAQFVPFPIYTWQEKSRTIEVEEEVEPSEGEVLEGDEKTTKNTKTEQYWEWELTNETKPIWMRNPKEVEKDQYQEFYRTTFNEFFDPLTYAHFTAEGEVEFRSVLYIPGMPPLNNEEIINLKTKNIHLYVKHVFFSEDFDGELFPRYLSFVRGVVDSDVNVSRDMSLDVRIMRKRLVTKVFNMIQDLSESENKEYYKKFWENFGKFMKLGCIEDPENHKRIAPLLRFFSSKSEEELISLDDCVDNMGESQKVIYYLTTDSLKSFKSAPLLEKLIQKGIEVLYLVEPIDEVAIQNLQSYKEKMFVDISKEYLELG